MKRKRRKDYEKKYYEISREIILLVGLVIAIYQLFQAEEGLKRSVANGDLQLAGYYLDAKREFIASVEKQNPDEINKAASEYGEIIRMGCTYYGKGLLGDTMRLRLNEDISAMLNNNGLARLHPGIREVARDCLE